MNTSNLKCIIHKRVIELHKDGACFRKLDVWFFKKHLKALLNARDLEALIEAIEREAAWNYLVRALGKKAHFCNEIKAKMLKRYVSAKCCDALIEKAKRYAYLDDERELENGIRYGLERGKGPFRLVMELSRRSGRSAAEIEAKIAELVPEEAQVAKGLVLIKRYKLPQERNKAYACLARRGFSLDVIQKVLQIPE